MRRLAAILFALALLLGIAWHASAELVERVLKVTFVSAELVYLNGGRAEGLSAGARPVVYRDEQRIAELEVVHLAEHSSACRFVGPGAIVSVGDIIKVSVEVKAAPDSDKSTPSSNPESTSQAPSSTTTDASTNREHPLRPDVSGFIGLLYSNWDDHGDADLDFSQSRVDIDFRVEPLWTTGLSFVARTSGRQDRRSASSGDGSNESWESRIATFAIEYKREGSPVGMSMGRINPARVGAIGRLDGASFEYRVSEPWRVGVFGGANSHWQYAENRPNLQTYGAYAGYRRGSARNLLFDQTLSLVGQYHGGIASREAVFAQGRVTQNGRWNLSHSLEVDVNRGWRKNDGNSAIVLSTIYAQGRVNLTQSVAASLSYDTRKSFRTYETRDVADSIFDDRARRGIRAHVEVNLPEKIVLSAGAGVRSVANESDRTISYNAAARKQGVFNQKSTLSVQGVVFESDANHGYNVNASLGQGLRQRDWISLGAGIYSYKLEGSADARFNRRADLTVRVAITQALSFNAMGQLSGGDDTQGHRLEAGLGVQF